MFMFNKFVEYLYLSLFIKSITFDSYHSSIKFISINLILKKKIFRRDKIIQMEKEYINR